MSGRRGSLFITGVLLIMGLFGCGKAKYKLLFDRSGFQSEKTAYSEGETVTVIYDEIATDTDYSFYTDSDDVKLDQTYDNNRGYEFTFTMPAHEVKFFVSSRNTMEADPNAYISDVSDDPEDYIKNENMVFDYYEATVATVGGDESTEYVLYEYDEFRLLLVCYEKSEGSEETRHYSFVSSSVLDDCMKLVEKYKMAKWENGCDLNGKRYVVRFLNDGEMVRASSDDMPEDGLEAFSAVKQVLVTEWGNASRKVDAGTWFCPECGTKNGGRYCNECGFRR